MVINGFLIDVGSYMEGSVFTRPKNCPLYSFFYIFINLYAFIQWGTHEIVKLSRICKPFYFWKFDHLLSKLSRVVKNENK